MLDYSCSSAAVDAYPYDEWTITNPEQLLATHLVLPAATVFALCQYRIMESGR